MRISFLELGGEFCTRRTSEAIPKIVERIEKAISENSKVICDWNGVKILTPSFIDEIVPQIIIKYGKAKYDETVSFEPQLTGFLANQVVRGVVNRSS